MKKPVVVVGMGEIGGIFARGFLRLGHPVYPVTREIRMAEFSEELPDPEIVVIAVAEKDIDDVMLKIPEVWRDHLLLLQNELLPGDWQKHNLDPTVITIWFEKRKGHAPKQIIPSPVYGKQAPLVITALAKMGLDGQELASAAELQFELVVKNVYILTTNICGLVAGGTVGELWSGNQTMARNVAAEVIKLQEKLVGQELNAEQIIEDMEEAIEGDPDHKCMGRSATVRLERALKLAADNDVDMPTIERIHAKQG